MGSPASLLLWPLLILSLVASCNAARPTPTKPRYILVLLGDSLTDTGNTFRAAGVPDPNVYIGPNGTYPGRYSNGRNWVDYLNATLSQKATVEVYNYAYGAATACAYPALALFAPFVKNVTGQAAAFIADVQSKKIKVDANTKVLVIQWIGSNDYLFALRDADSGGGLPDEASVTALLQSVTKCRADNLQMLAAVKGVVTDIAVLPISPLHISPQVPPALRPAVEQLEGLVGSLTVAAVKALQSALDALPKGAPGKGVNLYTIGATASWIARGVPKVKPPFKHTDDVPCVDNPNSPLVITPGLDICANPIDYLFYDESHPTSRFHEWFAMKGLLPRLQNLRLLPV